MAILGMDPDDLFAYRTPKVVVLRDRVLGLLRIFLYIVIIIYIFIWEFLYKGTHLMKSHVEGSFRTGLQPPTENACSPLDVGCRAEFLSLQDLPYCQQSSQPYRSVNDFTEQDKRRCIFHDLLEVQRLTEDGIMFPSRVRTQIQRRGCDADAGDCQQELWQTIGADGEVQQTGDKPQPPTLSQDNFVSDLERFTFLIDHQYNLLGQLWDSKDEKEMNGFWIDCSGDVDDCERRPIICLHDQCPKGAKKPDKNVENLLATGSAVERKSMVAFASGGKRMRSSMSERSVASSLLSEDTPVYSIKIGDIFSVGSLLHMANVSLDETVKDGGLTRRATGMVIVLRIEYTNVAKQWSGLGITPWGTAPVHYNFHAHALDAGEYKALKVDGGIEERSISIYNGIRLIIHQSGRIARFDLMYCLISLTPVLGLLAIAGTITELTMMYIMPRRKQYMKLKELKSKDFNPDEATLGVHDNLAPGEDTAGNRLLYAIEEQDVEALKKALPEFMREARA